MRVTQNLFSNSLVGRLNNLTARQYNLQSQASSGLRVQAPADDPTAMQQVLNAQTNQAAQQQYGRNIATLQSRAASTYSVLQQLQTQISNASVTAIQAGDSILPDLSGFAGTINTDIEAALVQVNKKDPATGQYLFGGTKSDQPPFAATRDASGKVTGVAYQGDTSVNLSEIAPGSSATTDVLGANPTGSGPRGLITDSASGADLFNHLISLRDHLLAGDKASITATDTVAIQKDENNILYQVSVNGALQSQLEDAAATAADSTNALNTMISNASSADLVQTMVQLSQAQNSYQAALQSGAKIMQMSLLNYIQ